MAAGPPARLARPAWSASREPGSEYLEQGPRALEAVGLLVLALQVLHRRTAGETEPIQSRRAASAGRSHALQGVSMKVRSAVGTGAAALGLLVSVVAMTTPGASAAGSHDRIPRLTVLQPRYDEGVQPHIRATAGAKASVPSIPLFHSSVTDGGTTFPYAMVGKNPFTAHANGAVSVPTVIVPVVVKLSNGDTFDPTVADTCAPSSSVTRVLTSPIFKSKAYTWGGRSVGTGQYVSVFRRAEFWQQTKPSGLNPDLQVNLVPTTTAPLTVTVPTTASAEGTLSCGKIAAMEISWWDNQVQTVLMPKLAAKGFGSADFPIFVLSNVVEFDTTPSSCCILGYHNAFTNPADGGVTTYGTAMYDNTHDALTGVKDISVLSHEVAEWMDDPLVNGTDNNTNPWGNIGQVTGCQTNLEVGDPLSGSLQNTRLGARTWHPQELAFFSWFYHQSPSTGVNHWYSSKGTFTTAAAPCP
jgi:hypothetical protein